MTIRVDEHVLTWARVRAFMGGSSLNAVVRRFLEEYAAVPARWMEGLPPPWTPENRIRPVTDPMGAGHRAAGRAESGEPGVDGPSEVLDSVIAQALSAVPQAVTEEAVPEAVTEAVTEAAAAEDSPPRQG